VSRTIKKTGDLNLRQTRDAISAIRSDLWGETAASNPVENKCRIGFEEQEVILRDFLSKVIDEISQHL
jgi:hypothetical protein